MTAQVVSADACAADVPRVTRVAPPIETRSSRTRGTSAKSPTSAVSHTRHGNDASLLGSPRSSVPRSCSCVCHDPASGLAGIHRCLCESQPVAVTDADEFAELVAHFQAQAVMGRKVSQLMLNRKKAG